LSDFDSDKSGRRSGIDIATCAAQRWDGTNDRSGWDPTGQGQWMNADHFGELPMVEPAAPELLDQLIDLELFTPLARTSNVIHPLPLPDKERIGSYGIHPTITL
jgi:hypothetical protein